MILTALTALSIACASERSDVKNMTDPASASINVLDATPSTIAELLALEAPKWSPAAPRHDGPESTAFEVHAYVTAWKLEEDGDLHVVVADEPQGTTMVVEFPDPKCVAGSTQADAMAKIGRAHV